MGTLDLILVVAAIGAAAVAVWVALARARLAALHAAEVAAREGAEREAAGVRGDLAQAREALSSAQTAAAQIGRQAAAQQATLDAVQGERSRLESELDGAVRKRDELQQTIAALNTRITEQRERADADRNLHAQQLASVEQARREVDRKLAEFDERFRQVFGSLAAEALKSSNEQFLKLATERLGGVMAQSQAELEKRRAAVDELVRPIAETLKRTDEKLAAIEKERTSAYAGLVQEVKQAATVNAELRAETGKLVRALSRPEVRGRYGEIQLRRVAELAGMTRYCDFSEQVSQRDSGGRLLRPDLIVKLPNNRLIAVDAKTNTDAYVQAMSATTPAQQEEHLERFARLVVEQVAALSKKGYWKELDGSPDFVVMFVPGDQFIDAALARRPDLLDLAAQQDVVLASPSTLIGLLRAVAVGWREQRLGLEAAALFELGKELHERAAVAIAHAASLGSALNQAVERYNSFAGSLESRLLPTLRKFEDSGVSSGKQLPELPTIEVRPRVIDPVDAPALPWVPGSAE